jgi:hypothetical protein
MRLSLLLLLLPLLGFSNLTANLNYFDTELSAIAQKFLYHIMDEDECAKLKLAAYYLTEEIKSEIKKAHKYNSDQIAKLKGLKKEAEALEYFISVVGASGNDIISLENFNLANKRVGAGIENVVKGKYCIDVISVTIGKYVAFLGVNASDKNYTVSYKWSSTNRLREGSGTMGVTTFSLRRICDNRDDPKMIKISVSGITCKEF